MTPSKNITYSRPFIVAILLATAFVTVLNQTLLIVAIPPIMSEFNINANLAQWVTTVYLLTNGILIPVSAFLIEKFSVKKLLITAMAIFTMGTVIGAIAPTFPILLIGRIVQAAGAGIIMPLMQTLILLMYPVKQRGQAMGLVGLVISFAPAIGPTLSGFLIDHFHWRYLFYTIIPIALIVLIITSFVMKNILEQQKMEIDYPSIIYSTLGWGGLLYGFSLLGTYGINDSQVIIAILIGIVSLTIFIKRQLRLDEPILEFRVFRSYIFTITTILTVFLFAILIASQTILPIFIQRVLGFSALESGLVLLPGAIIMGIMSPIVGRIFDKHGGKVLAIIGFLLAVVGASYFVLLDINSSLILITIFFTLLSAGLSLVMMPMPTAGINDLPPKWIAHGTAMNNAIRMVGGSIITGLLVSVMSGITLLSTESNPQLALLEGINVAFIGIIVMAILGFILAFQLSSKKKT
ncbi:MDR family MFS transporter [Gracilibacillus massiliensis]|uniref:MDR family MFS transporter n=1 Tax=Gracilibacillus massiliensis TaxID=1564956 RepID=UPI00071E263F|nr:MDR family MFS transporter [Gracilibacillus massiliensis]